MAGVCGGIRIIVRSLRGVTEAKFPSAFVITAFGAELCTVKSSKQAAASGLASDGSQSVLCGGWTVGSVLCCICNAGSGAAIGVTHQHTPEFIYGNIVKVEQVAAGISAALVPYTNTLHWIRRRDISRGPGAATVVGNGHIEVPYAGEVRGLRVARGRSAQKSERSATIVTSNHLSEFGILDTKRSTCVLGFGPV